MEPGHQSVQVRVTIQNRLGLHARPATSFVDTANAYASRIVVRKGPQVADGKSILQLMVLGATRGSELVIGASGPDASLAAEALHALINRGFDED